MISLGNRLTQCLFLKICRVLLRCLRTVEAVLTRVQQQRGCDPLEVEDEQRGGAKVESSRREKRRTKTARDELADLMSFPNESSR